MIELRVVIKIKLNFWYDIFILFLDLNISVQDVL